MFNQRLLSVVLALSIGSSSCWIRKQHARVFVPPPARPRPAIPARPPELPEAPALTEVAMLVLPVTLPPTWPPVGPPPAPRRPPAVPQPKPTVPPPASTVADVPVAPTPQLREMFTAEERNKNIQELEMRLDRTKKLLGVISAKRLNPEQTKIVQQVQAFVKQSEQARDQDLSTAINLAKHADLLVQDLSKRVP